MAVGAGMAALFSLPSAYFVLGTFAVTSIMIIAAYLAGAFSGLRKPSAGAIGVGLVSAAVLYAVFYAGNVAVSTLNIPGLSTRAEGQIYSLVASSGNPLALQVGVLAFDAVGYESFFRGVLQERLQPRLGVGAAPAVAALDASLHIVTLNPLWVATTFVADLGWGLTYFYGRRLPAAITSHFAWDLAIFIVRPIM